MKYTIEEVEVEFPFEAYPCQLQFMEAVIRALKGLSHAILESPTGTGKTLCLLCATLAYQRWYRMKEGVAIKVFYSSRTHSQLSQVIGELRGTSYHDDVRTAVLGSRDHLCVNTLVNALRGSALNASCRALLKKKACSYGEAPRVDRVAISEEARADSNCIDIEEMRQLGAVRGFCPFYRSRDSQKSADIVFVPYNYIIDPHGSSDSISTVDLQHSIVIIDEAHNLERACEDSASISFGIGDLMNAIRDLEKAHNYMSDEVMMEVGSDDRKLEKAEVKEQTERIQKLEKLRNCLKNIIHLLPKFELTSVDSSGRRECPITGQDVVGIFLKAGLTSSDCQETYISLIDKAQEAITQYATGELSTGPLQMLREVLSLVSSLTSGSDLDEFFRAFIQEGDPLPGTVLTENRVINLFCLSAAVAMRYLTEKKKVRNVLLASGTLSPMDLLQKSLGIPFGVVLENSHVIDPLKQVKIGVVCSGPNRVALNGSYQNKANPNYINDLGNLVINVSHVVPEGMLLVFHSYSQMFTVIKDWTDSGIYNRINREKSVFVEPRNAGELSDVLKEFAASTMNGNGAILFCVCRGKVTEGMDLSDNQCRGVIMAGIPFPAVQDKKVILKRDYLNSKNAGDGGKWYRQEAARAVNQTIGRTIRHKKDYGVILLCDERFRSYVGTSDLPKWLAPQVKIFSNFGPVIKDLSDFFRDLPSYLVAHKRVLKPQWSSTSGTESAARPMNDQQRQIESIQKLISSVPAPAASITPATIIPSIGSFNPNAFKMTSSTFSGTNPLKRQPSSAVQSSQNENIPSTQNSSMIAFEWIKRVKESLNRREYVLLKKSLRRLLEGTHSQCDVTVKESIKHLHGLLSKIDMETTFEQVIAGTNTMLLNQWRAEVGARR